MLESIARRLEELAYICGTTGLSPVEYEEAENLIALHAAIVQREERRKTRIRNALSTFDVRGAMRTYICDTGEDITRYERKVRRIGQ